MEGRSPRVQDRGEVGWGGGHVPCMKKLHICHNPTLSGCQCGAAFLPGRQAERDTCVGDCPRSSGT